MREAVTSSLGRFLVSGLDGLGFGKQPLPLILISVWVTIVGKPLRRHGANNGGHGQIKVADYYHKSGALRIAVITYMVEICERYCNTFSSAQDAGSFCGEGEPRAK